MVKRSKKSKSKRVSLKKKYKIIRKVKDHHKKKAKEAKKLGINKKSKVEKDRGIPNDWPFKEQAQHVVAKSNTEAEYRTIAFTSTELIWIQQLLLELQAPMVRPPIILCDNLSSTYMSANPVFHQHSKHIKIDFYFVREQVEDGSLIVRHVRACDQTTDIFTNESFVIATLKSTPSVT